MYQHVSTQHKKLFSSFLEVLFVLLCAANTFLHSFIGNHGNNQCHQSDYMGSQNDHKRQKKCSHLDHQGSQWDGQYDYMVVNAATCVIHLVVKLMPLKNRYSVMLHDSLSKQDSAWCELEDICKISLKCSK